MMLKLLPLQLTEKISSARLLYLILCNTAGVCWTPKSETIGTFFFFFLPCMNYWSGVDTNTDTRKSIFNQEPSLFLLMRENMSLLLRCLNLSWVSSQFHQMTIGNTYFIISPLNYRWDLEFLCPALLFLSLLLCFKNKNESIFIRNPGEECSGLSKRAHYGHFLTICGNENVLDLENVCAQKKRPIHPAVILAFRFGVNLSQMEPIGGVMIRK